MSRLLLILAFVPLAARGQVMCALGSGAAAYDQTKDERPSRDTLELAGQVNAVLAPRCQPNCPSVTFFRNATAANVMMIAVSDTAKLVYAPKFFTMVYETWGDGAIVALLAHAMGHAIDANAPAAWVKGITAPELRADAWAGCALGGNVMTPNAFGEALTALMKFPAKAHPAWAQRVPALRLGYTQCGGDGAKFDRAAARCRSQAEACATAARL
jgi:hypothetical protein